MKAFITEYTSEMREEVTNLQLRQADLEELQASWGIPISEAIGQSLDNSKKYSWVIKYGSKIVAVFGVALPVDGVGMPWLLGTDSLHSLKFRLIKYSQLVLDRMMMAEDVNCLTNYVSLNHTEAIKWLEWLGFTLVDPIIYFNNPDIPFKQFVKWRTT